jgi:hypothetical protein
MSDPLFGHPALESLDRDALRTALGALSGIPAEDCEHCLTWQVRYCVAVDAAHYISRYLPETKLRVAVLDDVAAAWVECLANGGHAEGFQGFFDEYCIRVEHNVDKRLHASPCYAAEFRREWSYHAVAVSRRARRRRTREAA